MIQAAIEERPGNELVDALPYVDHDYADPQLKLEVERLIEEEMSASGTRPSDYLPPLPTSDLHQQCPMVAKAVERLRTGRAPIALDVSRYGVQAPPVGKRNDVYEWAHYLRNAKVQLQYQTIKQENLELMLQHSGNVWRAHNQRLEAFSSRLQSMARELSRDIEALNRERKSNQQAAASILSRLESEWRGLCEKNTNIELACMRIEAELNQLREQAAEMGISLPSEQENVEATSL